MARTYSPVDLVQLPRIDANGAIALASAIESAAANDKTLPPNITEIVTQIADDRAILQAAVAKTPAGVLTVKEADRRVDKVGGALHDILAAWAELAEFIPEGQKAQIVLERAFQDGRRFINLKAKEEWAAVDTKLTTIDREGLAPNLDAIGAGPVLALLKQVHSVYGAVLGTTEVIEEAPEIRESKGALLDSIRAYVLRVAGLVKRGQTATEDRANALMKPILEWESTRAQKEKNAPMAPTTPNAPAHNPGQTGSTGP